MRDTRQTLTFASDGSLPIKGLQAELLGGPASGTRAEVADGPLSVGTAETNDLVVSDPTVSRFHLEISRRPDGILIEDSGSTNGTYVGELRVERAYVPAGAEVRVGRTRLRILDGGPIRATLNDTDTLGPLRGSTVTMRRLFSRVAKAGASDVSVLLVGESGTGKELVAQQLHAHSARAGRPFITVDCASLTPTLVASELFGHERGAFTGATDQRIGAFERANGGTIFLDEVGELPEQLQPMLLGVLERRSFQRLGGKDSIGVDLRVVAATNRNLRAEVNEGTFRLDLYYRLAVVRLEIPSLRERIQDLPLLIEHFARETGDSRSADELVDAETMSALARYFWPGNVRELRNYVEATVAMGEPPELSDPKTPDPAAHGVSVPMLGLEDHPYKEARGSVLALFEAYYLPRILERAKGNVSRAARESSMDRSHLLDLLRRHGLR